jgi:hypothetical protein
MATPNVTMRSALSAEATSGLARSAVQTQAPLNRRDSAVALAQALREALERARAQGLSAFAPDSATLELSGSVTLQERRDLFGMVIGQPHQAGDETAYPGVPDYGPLSLAQWSEAEEALALYIAREDSKLAAGAGGSPQYARGRWFVNGESYTMAELFLTVRMGNLGALDDELAQNLNILVANTNLARDAVEVLADMKRRARLREAQAAAAPATQFLAGDDFKVFIEAAGRTVPEVMNLGTRIKGANSYLQQLGSLALLTPPGTVSSSLYNDAMTELQGLFDSINAENDVKKLRVDTLHNARASTLEGMSAFLSSDVQQKKAVGRNL